MTVILDASALLSFLQNEPGNNQVEAVLPEDLIQDSGGIIGAGRFQVGSHYG